MSTPASEAGLLLLPYQLPLPVLPADLWSPNLKLQFPQILLIPQKPFKKFLISAYRFTVNSIKAVMTIAGFAFNAIRKGFTYCSRNVRWDISTSLYSFLAFTAPYPANAFKACRYSSIILLLIAIYHCFSHDPIYIWIFSKGFHHPSPSGSLETSIIGENVALSF